MAWSRVCRPPELGRLGIPDLQRFGFALRMRWLWLQRTEDQRPCHELSIEHEHVVDTMFQSSIYVELGNGHKALFWSDRWLEGHSLPELAPCLCNAVGAQVKKKRTVAEALQGDQWIQEGLVELRRYK